jgi:hypothetical protein
LGRIHADYGVRFDFQSQPKVSKDVASEDHVVSILGVENSHANIWAVAMSADYCEHHV